MIVVADTGPLRYLVEVGAISALPALYGIVLTTPQVMFELQQAHFPQPVQLWAGTPPAWLVIRSSSAIQFLDRLDDGEASALSLACETHAHFVLMDERIGRKVAASIGLTPLGTLALLQDAGYAGLIDFHAAIAKLTTDTAFRYTDSLLSRVVADYEAKVRERASRN